MRTLSKRLPQIDAGEISSAFRFLPVAAVVDDDDDDDDDDKPVWLLPLSPSLTTLPSVVSMRIGVKDEDVAAAGTSESQVRVRARKM